MQKTLIIVIVVAIVVVAGIVAGWQLTQVPSVEARNIKIGLVAPYSIPIGPDMDRAARMAVDEINAAGGVYVSEWHTRVNITLATGDTEKATPDVGVTAVTRLVEEEQVDLLIGGYGSSATLANEIVAIENRVPYIITGASSRLVTRRGPQGNYGGLPEGDPNRITDAEGMSYMFHYCTTTFHYSKTVVDFFAQEMKPLLDSTYGFDASRKLRLAVVYKNDAFGQGVVAASEYWIEAENLPIEIVTKRPMESSAISFQGDLTAVKDVNPDAVYVVHDPDKSPEIVKEGLVDVGLKSVYINIENNEDPTFYTLLKENGDKQLLESKFAPFAEPYIPAVGPYVESYMERYDIVPGMMGADTYDAFYIAKDAIERAGTLDKKAVRDALETTEMDEMLIMTETGKIQFSIGEDYHEIAPVTFIEQLYWNETVGECRPVIVWPDSTPGVSDLSKGDFVLPDEYEPGNP
jgi:branched-chain amino acid transport system substrate-binding protein